MAKWADQRSKSRFTIQLFMLNLLEWNLAEWAIVLLIFRVEFARISK